MAEEFRARVKEGWMSYSPEAEDYEVGDLIPAEVGRRLVEDYLQAGELGWYYPEDRQFVSDSGHECAINPEHVVKVG